MMDDATALKIAQLKNSIKQAEEEIDALYRASGIRDLPLGTHQYGPVVVEISRNARFDPAKATELFPLGDKGENMELYKAQVDSTLAKKHLTPDQYEACQKEFPNNKVEVRLA